MTMDGTLLREQGLNGQYGGDSAQAVALDPGGNVLVTAYSYSNGSDCYTAKYAAADGALVWEKPYEWA